MHIEVVDRNDPSNPQVRAYAEYRLFAALTPHTRRVRTARIALRRDKAGGAADAMVCAVTVTLAPTGSVRTRVRGHPATVAIDRAVERIGDLMQRAP